jgi:hypothetical protein
MDLSYDVPPSAPALARFLGLARADLQAASIRLVARPWPRIDPESAAGTGLATSPFAVRVRDGLDR